MSDEMSGEKDIFFTAMKDEKVEITIRVYFVDVVHIYESLSILKDYMIKG